jgi:hypothetical protein
VFECSRVPATVHSLLPGSIEIIAKKKGEGKEKREKEEKKKGRREREKRGEMREVVILITTNHFSRSTSK